MKAKVALLLEGIDIRERWHRDARATPGGSGQGHSRGPAYRRRASGASPGSAKFDGMAVGILLVTHPGIGSALVAVATSLLRNLPLKVERSEERRVGKECVSTCRSRWSPSHYKKKEQ